MIRFEEVWNDNKYKYESWVLTKEIRSRIQATKMKYLRKIKGIARRDRVRNEVVRQKLKVEPILKKIYKQQLKWFDHFMRTNKFTRKEGMASQDDREKEKWTPEKNLRKFNSRHFKRIFFTENEASKKVRNKKELAKFIHE